MAPGSSSGNDTVLPSLAEVRWPTTAAPLLRVTTTSLTAAEVLSTALTRSDPICRSCSERDGEQVEALLVATAQVTVTLSLV